MNNRPLNDFDATVLGQMGQIRAVGRKRLRNQNELDDFVQETVARVYANRAQLRDPAKLKQWIAGIARNTANELNRAGLRRREEPLPDENELLDTRDPHEQLERAERNEQIRDALNRLNPIDRDLLQGRYMEEESYADLQERHGLSYSAVGFRLHRAKRRLRKLLTGMKVAFALALANMKKTAFGGMLIMTKTTKIVLVAASALILALLGGYLWIEYGGSSDDSARGLTVEEQSPVIHAGADDKAASSAETETAGGAEGLQTPETPATGKSGETANPNAASAGEALSADAPDAFSTEFQEAIEEMNEFAKKLEAEFPQFSGIAEASIGLGDGLLKREAELRQQGMTAEERKTQLREKYQADSKALAENFMDPVVMGIVPDPSQPPDTASASLALHQFADQMRGLVRFMADNQPKKLETLLGLPTEDVSVDEMDAMLNDLDDTFNSFMIDAIPKTAPESR